ncbi:predicted protein [Plenodomus lingam JN3]|uniref:Predicted protein n=1 Tax=Leptosphaeria maculans (strain JN3 / isolate v23.1.3 / race Av1-4-5-6-7-8) TaxID=985895 RepID=E4ZTT9_LEPMJ|nr:predicted protein [Plenodomus lingam JN3]CBX94649.1 predicted protein [Plenodomus lingam JN3]
MIGPLTTTIQPVPPLTLSSTARQLPWLSNDRQCSVGTA